MCALFQSASEGPSIADWGTLGAKYSSRQYRRGLRAALFQPVRFLGIGARGPSWRARARAPAFGHRSRDRVALSRAGRGRQRPAGGRRLVVRPARARRGAHLPALRASAPSRLGWRAARWGPKPTRPPGPGALPSVVERPARGRRWSAGRPAGPLFDACKTFAYWVGVRRALFSCRAYAVLERNPSACKTFGSSETSHSFKITN